MNKYKHVLSPIQIGGMELKNRVTFSPTFSFFATADRHVNRELIEWMRPIARGGAACVNLGTGVINRNLPAECTHLVQLGQESVTNELSLLCDTIHAYDCKAGIEIYPIAGEPETFDERDKLGKPQVELDPNPLTKEQIKNFVEDFAVAADRVMRAGGDSIVVHGAHGQLTAAFFSRAMNQRHDEYGCDTFENRTRFTVEVLEAIRAAVGNNLAIEYRISADDMIPDSPGFDELVRFVRLIEDKIDLLHVSKGLLAVHKLTPYLFPPLYFRRGYNIDAAAEFKKHLNIPVSAVGGITLEIAEEAIASGKIDLVAISRGLLADPDLVKKAKAGKAEAIRPCVRCNTCIDRCHNSFLPIRCAVNPLTGREMLYMNFGEVESGKKVAIVGGGPAGMEAARAAAKRGHAVTLFEKGPQLGGNLKTAAAAAFKVDIWEYLQWAIRETVSNPKIKVLLNTEATPEMIGAEGFDAVIVAIGSSPIIPEFAKKHPDKVVWVGDVEAGNAQVGENVVVAGAGMTGCEAAVDLAGKGRKVTLIDMVPASQIGAGGTKINMLALTAMLTEKGVKVIPETRLEDVTAAGVEVSDRAGARSLIPCDTLVLSLGVRQNSDLARGFRECAADFIVVGDCATKRGTLYSAISTAHAAAMNIF